MTDEKHSCRVSVKGLALAGAILWGVYLFLLALLAGWGIKFMWVSKELVELLNVVYPGYVVGFGGAILGLIYGLVCGAICGGLIAWLHNKFCK
ncbi:MAG TPA: hypothetical protein ENI16_00500 [Candidatus Portnoybacteria bacterium]|nr:hypothetical protein [Candidatus Portnoybacteria bacterium]